MCPCRQTLKFTSERDREIKFRMHRKVCPNPVNTKQILIANKSMTLKEQQLDDAERKRKFPRTINVSNSLCETL